MTRWLDNLVCCFLILKFLRKVLEIVPAVSTSNFWPVGHETGLCIHYLTNTSIAITRKKWRDTSLVSSLLPTGKCKSTQKHREIILPMSNSLLFWHKQECKELMIHLFPPREAFSEEGRANSWKTNAETETKLACFKGVTPTSQQTFMVLTYFHRKQ